jgi:hypothetical protein
LVNPATSFDRTPWPAAGPLLTALPDHLYKLLPIALSPVLANPLNMAMRNGGPGDSLPQQASDLLYVSAWPLACRMHSCVCICVYVCVCKRARMHVSVRACPHSSKPTYAMRASPPPAACCGHVHAKWARLLAAVSGAR